MFVLGIFGKVCVTFSLSGGNKVGLDPAALISFQLGVPCILAGAESLVFPFVSSSFTIHEILEILLILGDVFLFLKLRILVNDEKLGN